MLNLGIECTTVDIHSSLPRLLVLSIILIDWAAWRKQDLRLVGLPVSHEVQRRNTLNQCFATQRL